MDANDLPEIPKDQTPGDKLGLFMFFQVLKQHGVITNVYTAFSGSLVKRINEKDGLTPADSGYLSQQKLKNLLLTKFESFEATRSQVERIIDELPNVRVPPEHLPLVQLAFETYLERPFEPVPGDDYYLFHRPGVSEPTGPRNEIKLDGDYVMFRFEKRKNPKSGKNPESPPMVGKVSLNFLRFFPHKNKGTRFMMLSLASVHNRGRNKYLGAKGWVDDLEDRYLATGQIINRSGKSADSQRVHGGMSTLIIEASDTAPLVLYRKLDTDRYRIEAAPCLHVRAPYGQEPSLSRAYLLRCRGLEHLGGKYDQIQSDRYEAIRELQKVLGEVRSSDMSLKEAAECLSKATGYHTDAFYRKDENGRADGVLVNLPFAHGSTEPQDNLPLMLPRDEAPIWAEQHAAKKVSGEDNGIEFRPKV